jgi:FkbM family methyltransferase
MPKFLYASQGDVHRKNMIGFLLLAKQAAAEIVRSQDPSVWSDAYELVWVPVGYIHSSSFPNAKRIIYGPHNFVLPEGQWLMPARFDRSVYTSLSPWNKEVYAEVGKLPMPVLPLPFPVDVDQWTPSGLPKSLDCFVYFKNRNPSIAHTVLSLIQQLGMSYEVIIYGQYNEQMYRSVLECARFGVWIGRHESQGFALEEALSMDVPLVVWDVESMFDEYSNGPVFDHLRGKYNLKATSVAYWDATCGHVGTTEQEIFLHLAHMKTSASDYHPREFIVNTLAPEACWKRIQTAFSYGYVEFLKDPTFLVIGAMDGISHDNLAPYIRKHKFKGIFVEPVKAMYNALVENYKDYDGIVCENCAITESSGTKPIYRIDFDKLGSEYPDWSDGGSSFIPERTAMRWVPNLLQETVTTKTLKEVLDKHTPGKIDILQIDCEGYDLIILKQFDFTAYKPFFISVEHLSMTDNEKYETHHLLHTNGYSVSDNGSEFLGFYY